MDQAENSIFPSEEPDIFDKLLNDFANNTFFSQTQVNQIISFIFSVDHNEILHYQKSFISFLVNPPQFSSEIISSPEMLNLIAVALSTFQISYLDKPIHDLFIQNWSKFIEKDDIDTNDLFMLVIIFHQLIFINDMNNKQLIEMASIFIHFLELDCLSNIFPISLISFLLDSLHHFFKKISISEMKRKVISSCYQYVNATSPPIKMLVATKFIILNSDQYDKCLQYIIQSLQLFQLFHEDSLQCAFISISNFLYINLKKCSLWSIHDAFLLISDFSIQQNRFDIIEDQINAILALNFYGIEKKINNEMDYFNFAINSIANESVDVPLLQLCDSFRFSPVLSIRNYQIFTIFFIFSIKIETFIMQIKDEAVTDSQLLNIIESFGRNFEYFKSIVHSICFFNGDIENGMFHTINELKKPIMNQFILTMKMFLQFNIEFSSKYEYPKDECTAYDNDCYLLLEKYGQQCKHISIIKKAWEILNYTTRRIFEFLDLFPTNILSIIYSNYIDLLFNINANQIYVYVMIAFFPCIDKIIYFLISFYREVLKNIKNSFFIKNAVVFLKWLNQLLKKNTKKCQLNEYFNNSSKNFFIEFFKYTFSTSYTILLHSTLIKKFIKLIQKLFGETILFKIIPADVLISLYFSVPSSNKDNKYLNTIMIQLYPSHKSVLSKFEWYHKLLLKHSILKPKISIPAIKENKLIYDYRHSIEFQKFTSDLLTIFDSYSSNELRKIVIEMISYIPAKFTSYRVPQIVDISQKFIYTIVYDEKMLVINGRELVDYIREIITCEKPENQFDNFVNFINFHSINKSEDSQAIQVKNDDNDGLFAIFEFLSLLATAAIDKCESREQFLFIQDIFTLIIKFGSNKFNKYLPKNLTSKFFAHFIVSLAINNHDSDIYVQINDNNEYFSEVLSNVEQVLFNVSYPCYQHSTFVFKFLIEHFSKSSIDFLQMTKFALNFILRQLNEDLLTPSHHINTNDNIKFNICHFLPSDVFEIVIYLKENIYNYNAIDFIPLFNIKFPFIATFSLCEIISKSQMNEIENENGIKDLFNENKNKKKRVIDFLDEFAGIDLIQIVPLLLLFPEYQENYINLCSDSIKISKKSQENTIRIPFIFFLLDLPQSMFKNFVDDLKSYFLKSKATDSLLISECLLKADSVYKLESKKKSILSTFASQILSNNGFNDDLFVSNDLSSFKYLFPLFILQPEIVVNSVINQLTLLNEKKYKNSLLVDSNFKFLLEFLSLPSVINYIVMQKEYKKVGKLLLKIYSSFSFDVSDLMVIYFSFKPKIWAKFIVRNIAEKELIFFFFENIHSGKLSQIIYEIRENTELLSKHLQNEFVQFFAIENPDISFNQIKESFMSYFTQKDRYFIQQLISYLVDNGDIWDLILAFIKSKKIYLIQTLKLEILKNGNHDLESLPNFIEKISIEHFSSFFEFFFDCYKKSVDFDIIEAIVSKLKPTKISLFEKIYSKYSFDFQFDFYPFYEKNEEELKVDNEWSEFENNLFYFRIHDFSKIKSIFDEIDIDSPSYIFEEIEKLIINENYESINTLMIRFINHVDHFVSILKFIEKNKTTFYANVFDLFSNELTLFVSMNLLDINEENLHNSINCFNVLCSLLPSLEECNSTHFLWIKKLSEIGNSILPVFVKDDNFFHSNYKEFNNNLILLVSLYGSQCVFIKTYFGIISKFYYENKIIILQELFESVPKILHNIDKINEIDLHSFISLLCELVNESKHLVFPYALYSLNELNQKGIGNIKKITGLLSMIIKGELNEIHISKLNFNFDFSFMDSLKNVFCRWFLKDLDTESYSTIMSKVGQKSELSNWLLFSRSQLFDDFNVCFKSENQYNHFFNIMPFEIIQKYQKFIVDESSIPIYYYKKLSSYKTEKKNEKNPVKQFMTKKKEEKGKFKNFFKLFSIEYYYNHIISNTENRIISFKSISDSEEAFDYLNNSEEKIDFYSGIESCIFQPGQNLKQANINNSNNNRNSASSFQLLQDAMTIIGIPKCYPNQIIERLSRAKDDAFLSLKSSEIVQFLCLCSLCHNPIVPPYFSRYHSIKLFEDFNRILNFATTKGINVDFSPLEKSEPFINQSQCSISSKEKVQMMKTKENFLIYAMKNQFNNPQIWADLSAIENDDILYLFLHSNILPLNAKKEVLKQIKEFPFRWCQILFDDIKRGILNESFISLVIDVFRIDYSSVFECITGLDEIKKLRTKSFFESKIIDEEHPQHNFSFIVSPIKKFFPVLPIIPPLLPNDPLSSFNFPMHSIFLSIEKENSSFASIDVFLADGSKVNYLITGMVEAFSPELFILSSMLNKILRKRVYCRSKHSELFSPQIQQITKESKKDESKLFLVRTNAKPLIQYSIYDDLLMVKREGKYPPLKKFNVLRNFKASKEFFAWENAFLHRFAALSHLQVGLGLKVILPFHLLVDEKNASIQFLQLRKPFLSAVSGNDGKSNDSVQKMRVFGDVIKFMSSNMILEVLPTAMVNVAVSFKFYTEKLSVILNNLLGIGYSEKMEKFNLSLQGKNGIKVVEDLLQSSCTDVPINDIPWF